MFGIGGPELLIIVVVALVVIGPKKLPEMMRTIGKGLAEFKRVGNDVKSTLDTEIQQAEAETRKQDVDAEVARRQAEKAKAEAQTEQAKAQQAKAEVEQAKAEMEMTKMDAAAKPTEKESA